MTKLWTLGNWPTFMTTICSLAHPRPLTSTYLPLSLPFWPPCTLLSTPALAPQIPFALFFPGESDNCQCWASHLDCYPTSYGLCPQLYPGVSSLSLSCLFPSAGEGLLCVSHICAFIQHTDPGPAGGKGWQRSAGAAGVGSHSKVQGLQKGRDGEREIDKWRELNQRQVQPYQGLIRQRKLVRPCSGSPSCCC